MTTGSVVGIVVGPTLGAVVGASAATIALAKQIGRTETAISFHAVRITKAPMGLAGKV
jgi:hypothetical protein